MKISIINRFLTLSMVMVLVVGIVQAQAQTTKTDTTKKTGSVDKTDKEAIENIIREYLLNNPSIIREAMQALQLQEEKERQERAASNLKSLERELYSDPDSPTAGNPRGDFSIVVFFDYKCGYCKQSLIHLGELISKDESIRIVFKEYPILSPQSEVGTRAALAANRQGKYVPFHNALFEAEEITDDVIKGISDKLGLNYARLQEDMNDPKISESLTRNFSLAGSLEIGGTPAYIIGEQIIPGAIDLNAMMEIVSAERAKLVKPKSVQANTEPKK